MVYGNLTNAVLQHRLSALNVPNCEKPHCRRSTLQKTSESRNLGGTIDDDDDDIEHTDIEYKADECAITNARLSEAHKTINNIPGCADGSCLSNEEKQRLGLEQRHIRKTLNLPSCHTEDDKKKHVVGKTVGKVGHVIKDTVQDGLARLHIVEEADEEEVDEEEDEQEGKHRGRRGSVAVYELPETITKQLQDDTKQGTTATAQGVLPTPQDVKSTMPRPQDDIMSSNDMIGSTTVKVQLMAAKLRSRLDQSNDGVLGVQKSDEYCLPQQRMNSLRGDSKFMLYNKRMSTRALEIAKGTSTISLFNKRKTTTLDNDTNNDESKEDNMDVEDISYVRKPNLARIIEQYEALSNHPKYSLKQVVLSRRFHLYAHRFGNAQYQHTLVHPTLKQPSELYSCPWLMERSQITCMECKEEEDKVITEKYRSRKGGHRFIIAADTQFGILMDGFAMEYPNWSSEIEISRKCVKQINAMTGCNRPLFVCVCGDLVDTESSFSGAIASWKKVMQGWERNLVFQQQVNDFKRVWAGLDADIALVCLCGNHDVGNRPSRESIEHWTSSFGDDYLSFWANGTYNICLNNCLFSNPTGAPDLFEEQLQWMEERLIYGRENNASHIFVFGHFPWFLKHEEEADDEITSYSGAPTGWGPPGSSFADSYFTIPLEQRRVAMALFKKYDVTACFSGHFHQNVVTATSWGMPMIVTGPLSMNLYSDISEELSNGETNGIGFRVVDVGERPGEFTHKWHLLDDEEELYTSAMNRCLRQSMREASLIKLKDNNDTKTSALDNSFCAAPPPMEVWNELDELLGD